MNLNASRVRAERERRGWSQEHLASLTGLSPRTIQRVEATGIASNESGTALAAVFGVGLDALRPSSSIRPVWHRTAAAVLASGALVALGALISNRAPAAQLLMDVCLTVNGQVQRPSQVITKAGHPAEIQVDGAWRVSVLPTLRRDGTIGLGLHLYQYNGKDYVLLAHPLLVAQDNTDAEMRLDDTPHNALRVVIRPHKI